MGGEAENGMQKLTPTSLKEVARRVKPSQKIDFICGCWHSRSATANASMNPKNCDAEGFVLCPDHKVRRKGWRSVVKTQQRVALHPANKDAEEEFIERPDYSYGMDYLAMEKKALGLA